MVPEEDIRKLSKDYKPNRAERRKKPINSPWFTKATHSFSKLRRKSAKSKQQRKKETAKALKEHRQSLNTVVS